YSAAKNRAAIDRMFERDKDQLRALGLPIRVRDEETDEGTTQRYYMRARETYLPFLNLAAKSATARPTRTTPSESYRDLTTITFEPDELSALVQAARCAKRIGDPALTHDIESAIAKLTYDLGLALGAVVGESDEHATRIPEPGAVPAVSTLGEALLR